MNEQAANRIVELAWHWQNRVQWEIAFESTVEWRKYRDKANQDRATAKRMRDSGQQGEMLEMFQHDAERFDEIAETCHKQAVTSQQDLLNLANLLREHAPKLLRLVPVVNFFDAPPADLLPWLSAMREIESEILALVDEDDLSAYLPASKVNKGRFPTLAALNKTLAKIPNEIIRRRRIGERRTVIHVADWERHWDEQDRIKLNALDSATISDTIAAIEAEREKVKSGWTGTTRKRRDRK